MPQGPIEAYRTFGIRMPRTTHWRALMCEEAECEHWRHGWVTRVDTATELGVRQARYILDRCGRSFTKDEVGTMLEFRFPPGQRCFREHKEPNGRPSIFITRRGDWRGNPEGNKPADQLGVEEWADRFRAQSDLLSEWMRKG